MNKLYFHISVISLLIIGVFTWEGCSKSTLAPGGAYAPASTTNSIGSVLTPAPDLPLFVADSTYQLAYTAIDAVFSTERNNRAFLWSLSPKIKHDLDTIRPQAVQLNAEYLEARTTYLTNGVPDNLTKVQAIVAKLQQVATAAQSALPKGQ